MFSRSPQSKPVSRDSVQLALVYAYLGGVCALLWLSRGYDTAGWESLGAAQAVLSITADGFKEAFLYFFERAHGPIQCWNTTYSVLFGFIPGLLHLIFPWQLWSQLFNLGLFLGISLLAAHRLNFDRRVYFLLFLASPTLVSHVQMGYPYWSALLPFALALMYLHSEIVHKRHIVWYVVDVIAWVAIFEVAVHCYELGMTVFSVLAIAAVALKDVHWPRRIFWLALAGVMCLLVVESSRGNLGFHDLQRLLKDESPASVLNIAIAMAMTLLNGVVTLFKVIYVKLYLDSPVLITLGMLSLPLIRKNRWFWILLWLSQLALLLIPAITTELSNYQYDDYLRPRRASLFIFYSLFCICAAWQSGGIQGWAKRVFVSIILLGHCFSLYTWGHFAIKGIPHLTLPYTHSQADLAITRNWIDDSNKLIALINSNDAQHYFLYGYSSYPENSTDPLALPERLALSVEPGEYLKRVRLVDNLPCRYSCMPSIKEEDLSRHIIEHQHSEFYLHIYKKKISKADDRSFEEMYLNQSDFSEVDLGLELFTSYLVREYRKPEGRKMPPSDVRPLPSSRAQKGMCYWQMPYQALIAERLKAPADSPGDVSGYPLFDWFHGEVSRYYRATTYNSSGSYLPAAVELMVDDEAVLYINGTLVINSPGAKASALERVEILLPPGVSVLEVYYTNLALYGEIKLRVVSDDQKLDWWCEGLPEADSAASLR